MPKQKQFKYLSKSQQNRRFRKFSVHQNVQDLMENENRVEDQASDSAINTVFEEENLPVYVEDNLASSERSDDDSNFDHIEDANLTNFECSDDDTDDTDLDNDNTNDDDNEIKMQVSDVKLPLRDQLARWVFDYNITHEGTAVFLSIIKNANLKEIIELPSHPRTLLHTPRKTTIRVVPPGEYFHYGLQNSLLDQLKFIDVTSLLNNTILINVNVDGLPISKSSKSQLYPILGEIYPRTFEPFVIGIYHGHDKPHSCTAFLDDFIKEYKTISEEGFDYCGRKFQVKIRAIICDAPARSFVACTKGHNGYFGCSKCRQKGIHKNHRMLFPKMNIQLRTDLNFLERIDKGHHVGVSPFEQVNVGMVSELPLDYMHLVCLGVVKKILLSFKNGEHKYQFSPLVATKISQNLKDIGKWIPSEFEKKPRELMYIDKWKATEFRLFLLYIGPVVLLDHVPDNYHKQFICLHCAIRILSHEEDCKDNNIYAGSLLRYFVEQCDGLFGENFVIYNVHNLIHLADDVLKLGDLYSFSAFAFENYLHTLKKKLRKADKPLQQLYRRITELSESNYQKKKIMFNRPTATSKNSKISRELGLISYNNIHYKNFLLSVANPADQYCYLDNYSIIRVENIYVNNKTLKLRGRSLINPEQFPNYPIDSRNFNIALGNNWSQLSEFNVADVIAKAVCIPYQNSYCFLPLIHSCI